MIGRSFRARTMRGPDGASWSHTVATPAWVLVVALAVLTGVWLRLDQFMAQVLIDDEWHVVHQVLQHGPGAMFFDFGYADYSIPLGILAWYEAQVSGLSELMLRMPMLVCGIVALIVFPLYVAPRLSRATSALFAILLALSPLLVVFSRLARPYAITLLLGWIAHAAFNRFNAARSGRVAAGVTYVFAATLATWLHPLIAPFALAPLVWGLGSVYAQAPTERRASLRRLLLLAAATGLTIAALILPPLFANPQSLAGKSGTDVPGIGTLAGVWYAWLGTPSTIALMVCIAFAVWGAPEVRRALPEARTGALGVALTLVAVLVSRPMWSFNPLTLARYLLPLVPLLLLFVAAGAARLAYRLAAPGNARARVAFAIVLALPIMALAAESPLGPMLRYPNAQALDSLYYIDFRLERNPIAPYQAAIPLSPFWAGLAAEPPGSIRIAAAPFYFESYDWDAPRWERLAHQTVVPGYLTALCVDKRWGEVPLDTRFRFRNAVHLADDDALARRHIDYVVWQKPYVQTTKGTPVMIGADTAHCETALRAKFGAPAFEDSTIIAFRVPRHAQR
jgi:hypothetical protein